MNGEHSIKMIADDLICIVTIYKKNILHNVDICYEPCEDGETLLKVTAQVKMIQTARAILGADRGQGKGCG